MGRISVIIPLFNDADNIVRCLESVCAQTISGLLDILIVDDGSTDNSVPTARNVLESHSMLQQAHIISLEQNHGVANARKVGVQAAQSDFILFCDSDDWMEPTMCEKLLAKAENEMCDLVICDYNSIRGNSVEPVSGCYKENFLQQLILCTVTGALWNKLIKTDILRRPDFLFPVHDFSEDYAYSLQFAIYARNIGYVPEALYNYVHRSGSVVQSTSAERQKKRYDDDMQNFRLDLVILEKNGLLEKYREEIIAHKLKMKNTYRNDNTLWRSTFPELKREIFQSGCISFRSKLSFILNLLGIR